MHLRPAGSRLLLPVLCLAGVLSTAAVNDEKPSISVKASPMIGFAPIRIVLTADVKGGPNDYEQFYCATVEWDMGDGNKSEQAADCEPYEAGKSEIKRRYVRDQVFQYPGDYRVEFRLKQKDKIVGTGRTTIKIRPGLRDGGGQ